LVFPRENGQSVKRPWSIFRIPLSGIYGKFSPVLYEACRYIPELIPDAVDPDEEELKKWLRE